MKEIYKCRKCDYGYDFYSNEILYLNQKTISLLGRNGCMPKKVDTERKSYFVCPFCGEKLNREANT